MLSRSRPYCFQRTYEDVDSTMHIRVYWFHLAFWVILSIGSIIHIRQYCFQHAYGGIDSIMHIRGYWFQQGALFQHTYEDIDSTMPYLFSFFLISHLARAALVLSRLRVRASAPRLPGEIRGNIYLVLQLKGLTIL